MPSAPVLDAKTARYDLACLLCGSSRRSVMHEKAPFQIVRCADCGLVYTLPRLSPDAIRAMYQSEYWKSDAAKDFGYTDYLADEALYVKTFRMRGAWIARHRPPPARLLDVGCAAGFALTAMRDLGFEVAGVELSQPMVDVARRRLATDRIHCGVLEDVERQNLFGGRFDVITMFDVVEHVEDPVALLACARRLLAPGGIVVFETQNVASLFARLLGVRWQHYKFQEHLYHFDPKTAPRLLEKAGLEMVEWTPRRGGKHVSVGFLIERAGRVHPLLSALMKPLAPFKRRSLYMNVFDEMLVVARVPRAAA
jgi:2-polyprenyl-3-methyl-5-hydroxy-6-metoxy-1,4-benzoquinol methylase